MNLFNYSRWSFQTQLKSNYGRKRSRDHSTLSMKHNRINGCNIILTISYEFFKKKQDFYSFLSMPNINFSLWVKKIEKPVTSHAKISNYPNDLFMWGFFLSYCYTKIIFIFCSKKKRRIWKKTEFKSFP